MAEQIVNDKKRKEKPTGRHIVAESSACVIKYMQHILDLSSADFLSVFYTGIKQD